MLVSEDRCLNRCSISFAKSCVENCLELNFKYVDYQCLRLHVQCIRWSVFQSIYDYA